MSHLNGVKPQESSSDLIQAERAALPQAALPSDAMQPHLPIAASPWHKDSGRGTRARQAFPQGLRVRYTPQNLADDFA